MVNTIKFGDIDNLSTYKDIHYPLVNFEFIDSKYKFGFKNSAKFQFHIMDLSNDFNEFDVIDSCHEIANDYLKYLEGHFEIEIQSNISLVPFGDDFGDRCAGVAFMVEFNVHRNNCEDILPTT
ncbi:hypothetical protein [Sphingobacterium sp.]|uniref:hypothetical protein n=1 Tax=Sphingobacterium sp. TaxID=341027 RepID=UPI0028B00BD9|nr:hypothetical protein [Sphingobacterium sp.]